MKSKSNYLKYWRTVKYYVKLKHGLTESELDMILFLYSEKYFTKDAFVQYQKLMSWDRNKFFKMVKDGWIDTFRKKVDRNRTIYQLSHKAEKMVSNIYNILDGKDLEFRSIDKTVYKAQVSFTDKFYLNMIMKMKEEFNRKRIDDTFEML